MLMGVCSLWRKIVLDIPQLWARIWIAPPMIGSWIIRSKGLPLDLKLSFPWGHAPTFSALDALIPHAHRWEQIDFRLAPSSNSALAPVKARLQSLKQLKLSFARVTGTVVLCEIALQLTEIWLKTIYEPVVIKLPWEQLRVCALDNIGVALYILQQAKNLETCHIRQHDSDPVEHWLSMPRDPHSHHPKLDTLIVGEWRQVADLTMSSFFFSLTLPSLRVLDVHFPLVMCFPGDEDSDDSEFDDGYVDGPQFASRFRKFIKRSSRHLDQLRLIRIPFTPSQFIDCLALAQSVVSLEIQYEEHWDSSRNNGVNDEFLHALSANSPRPILPCLRSLTLRGECHFLEESFDTFVTSRQDINPTDVRGVALLENLVLDCSTPMGWPTEPRRPPSFHRFTSEGLNIEYGSYWGI
ncbi:hypothetical protein BD779DRAFT_923371 [Infundibulicybe gibba]|nr:hypothetical protein BD779DRAFT_923371 [Infundibulicybe gibba]